MATSGASTFNMSVDEAITEAFEQMGIVPSALTGYDLKTGRRSLSLLLQEFSNRNVFAFVSEKDSFSTTATVDTYTLDANTNDVRNVHLRVGTTDTEITRYSYGEYARLGNKSTTGRPSICYVDRQRDSTSMKLWPVPDATYSVQFEKLRKIEDVGAYTNNIDVPVRVLPAITSGLAYRLALKKPGTDPNRIMLLKADFDQQFAFAMEDDIDRIPTIIRIDPTRRR